MTHWILPPHNEAKGELSIMMITVREKASCDDESQIAEHAVYTTLLTEQIISKVICRRTKHAAAKDGLAAFSAQVISFKRPLLSIKKTR